MMLHVRTLLCTALVALPLHAGFASPADSETHLRARARGYWEAKIKETPERYAYYVPETKGGPQRRRTPEHGAVHFTSYEILGATIEGDRATVTTKTTYRLQGRGVNTSKEPREKTLRQTWVRVDGEWYKQAPKPGLRLAERFQAKKRAYEEKKAREAEAARAAGEHATPPGTASE